MTDFSDTAPLHCLRLLGATFWRPPGSAVEALLRLRAEIAARNAGRSLRTALLHAGGWLVHWHEGPPEQVEAAWDAASEAPGHEYPRVLHRSAGPGTLTALAQLATLHGRERPTEFAHRLFRIEREQDLGWQAEPSDIWQALSAPCQMDAHDPVGALLRRRVVLVTSEDNESVEFLRKVAERTQSTVVYQRFAGGDLRQADAGGGYVDVRWGPGVTRVQALARQALSQELVRLSLGNLQWLVLLLGQRERAAASLVASVAPLLDAVAAAPSVLLAGPDAGMRLTAAAVLQAQRRVALYQIDSAGLAAQTHLDAVMDLICAGPDSTFASLDPSHPVSEAMPLR